MRAIGLDYEQVTKWLELPEQQEAILVVNKIAENFEVDSQSVQRAKDFVGEFRRRLVETKTDKMLIRFINQHLQAFGPSKIGPNLLINRYLPTESSLLAKVDKI